jgi:siroheme synthase
LHETIQSQGIGSPAVIVVGDVVQGLLAAEQPLRAGAGM